MSTQVPDYLANRGTGRAAQVTADSVHGMGAPPVPFISIEGNRFTLIDAAGNDFPVTTMGPIFTTVDAQGKQIAVQGSPAGTYLDAVLVDVNPEMSKVYYSDPYTPNQQNYLPPSCWSDNGVAPSVNAMKPQALRCELCPWNEWGSKINALGHRVKACDDVRKMGFYVPELAARGIKTVFLLRLKGSSHKNWRSYAEEVNKQRFGDRPMQVTDLITRIYFDQGEGKNVGILKFSWAGLVDRASAALQDEVWNSEGCVSLLGLNDQPIAALPQGWVAPTGNVFTAPAAVQGGTGALAPPPIPPVSHVAPPVTTPSHVASPPPPPTPVWNPQTQSYELPLAVAAPVAAPTPPPPPVPVWNSQTQAYELPGQPAAPQQVQQAPTNGRRGPRGGRRAPAALQGPQAGVAPAPAATPKAPAPPPPVTASAVSTAAGGGAPGPAFQPGQMPDLPGFLRRPAVAPDTPAAQHGMQQPDAPNPAVVEAINQALNVPVPR